MIRIDTGKTTKKGVGIIKFYHKECLQISNQNKASNERRSSAYSKESDTHENLKNVIYKKLINGDLNLVDQFGMYIQFNKESFVAIESPVIVELQNRLPFYDKESCKLCFKEYNLENSEITSLLDRTGHSNYIDGDNHYSLHPCIKCPFNKNTYKHIFDIGIGYNGKYTDVIEILHTSKCKSNKIKYCIQTRRSSDLFAAFAAFSFSKRSRFCAMRG
jgi:hypothetical protein